MKRAADYIDDLAASGRSHFTTEEAIAEMGGSEFSVRNKILRLRLKGKIATPYRSFHLLVPPMYRSIECPPPEQFIDQLMSYLNEPYYVGLLSAGVRYGAAHQRPQVFQVMTRRNRPKIHCGRFRIHFIARADLEKMPVEIFPTPNGKIRYASPETTAFELVGYPTKAAGMSNVTTVLIELAESLDCKKLEMTAKLQPTSWSQRVGYLLEMVGEMKLANSLYPHVQKNAQNFAPLMRSKGIGGCIRDRKWKLIINTEVDPDL